MMEAGLISANVTNEQLLERIHEMHRTVSHIGHLKNESPFNRSLMLDEWVDTSPNVSVNTVTLRLGVNNPVRIESLIWSIPSATGMLTIGRRSIPLTANNGSWMGLQMIVFPEDPIVMTSTTSGQLYLEIMGSVFLESSRWNRV